ncbi:TerD family protein [Abyssisolibacter fermentans]|uniref:TerD family protein n=1 Tax=Abyssisolibacter fermentans TaxID=1766203 RepID=UPI000832B52A|nr:TerD family protein [Abyssisolibacter fermentans]
MNLVRGQKADITKGCPALSTIKVGLGWDVNDKGLSYDLDAVALLLDSTGKLASNKDIVFYNNLKADSDNIKLTKDNRTGIGDGDDEEIIINLKSISPRIEKIIISITIHNADKNQQHFGQVSNAFARVVNTANNQEIFRYSLTDEFPNQTALILGEIYKRNGEWRFSAVGRGVQGGIAGLCSNYGAVNLPNNFFTKKAIPSASKGIKLSKIELKKSGDSINLNKSSKSLGEIVVNLNWNHQKPKQSGLLSSLFGGNSGIDLDLGCLFELKTGEKGCIQALGNLFGSFNSFPFISLDGDDRTGANLNGENLRINGNMVNQFHRILVFSYIYEGAKNWSQVDGVVTLKTNNGDDITVRMDEHKNGLGMCSIALLQNLDDETFKVQKAVKYFNGHQNMDKYFGWGLKWVYGRK